MMFKYINNISEVKDYNISSCEINYASKGCELWFRNEIITRSTSVSGVLWNKRYFFYSDNLGNCYKDLLNNEIINLNRVVPQLKFDNNKYVALNYSEDYQTKDLVIFNFDNNSFEVVKLNIEFNIKLVINEQILNQKGNTNISSLSLLTGLYSWEIELSVSNIISIIGIYTDYLIVTYETAANQTGILALDVATGNTVWDTLVNGVMYSFYPIFSKNGATVFNLHAGGLWLNGIQMAQGNNIFREIDLTNGTIKREGILQELDNLGLGVKYFVLNEDNICFTANYNGSFGAIVVGVLDYETLSLLWWEEVKMDEADGFGNFLTQIQVSENNIYVLDKTGTLHIYEKDDTQSYQKPTESGLTSFEYLPIFEEPPHYPENDDLPF